MKNPVKSYGTFLNESSLYEAAKRRESAIVSKEQEMKLVQQINNYTEKMKNNPERANYYKAMIDLTNAKLMVITLRRKVEMLKGQ
ncbi:hypothetical protein EBU94_00640 [bacterium]|jgi:hypothetical protein|nr:hypothetical protein [bacterium]